jgi:hypothetical protein
VRGSATEASGEDGRKSSGVGVVRRGVCAPTHRAESYLSGRVRWVTADWRRATPGEHRARMYFFRTEILLDSLALSNSIFSVDAQWNSYIVAASEIFQHSLVIQHDSSQ